MGYILNFWVGVFLPFLWSDYREILDICAQQPNNYNLPFNAPSEAVPPKFIDANCQGNKPNNWDSWSKKKYSRIWWGKNVKEKRSFLCVCSSLMNKYTHTQSQTAVTLFQIDYCEFSCQIRFRHAEKMMEKRWLEIASQPGAPCCTMLRLSGPVG